MKTINNYTNFTDEERQTITSGLSYIQELACSETQSLEKIKGMATGLTEILNYLLENSNF